MAEHFAHKHCHRCFDCMPSTTARSFCDACIELNMKDGGYA